MSKVIQCIKEPTSNKYYTTPFTIGEKVILLGDVPPTDKHPEIYFKQFIRIKRLKPLEVRVEMRKDFSNPS